MTEDRIIERIRKLLALADVSSNGTDAERDSAMQKAQELLLKHNLDMFKVTSDSGVVADRESIINVLDEIDTNGPKCTLVTTLAQMSFCKLVWAPYLYKKRLHIIGTAENIEAVRVMYGWYITQLEMAYLRDERPAYVHPVKHRRSFLLGAVTVLTKRLRDARKVETTSTVTALVRIADAENERVANDKWNRLVKSSFRHSSVDGGSYDRGEEVARKMSLTVGGQTTMQRNRLALS